MSLAVYKNRILIEKRSVFSNNSEQNRYPQLSIVGVEVSDFSENLYFTFNNILKIQYVFEGIKDLEMEILH